MFSRSDLKSIFCTKASGVFDHSPQPAFTLSSAPSGQSLSPSHTQRCGTHLCESGHWNASALQVLFSESKTHIIHQHIKLFLEEFNVIYYVKCPYYVFFFFPDITFMQFNIAVNVKGLKFQRSKCRYMEFLFPERSNSDLLKRVVSNSNLTSC